MYVFQWKALDFSGTCPSNNKNFPDISFFLKECCFLLEVLPLEMAAEASFDRESNTYFFVRPTYHNNVTKRYQGGTARQLWKYSNGAAEAVKLTKDYAGEDHHPIFHQGRVYFISSRDGIQNVWSMKPDGSDIQQHTKEVSYDVREYSLSGNTLVYRSGADLFQMNL